MTDIVYAACTLSDSAVDIAVMEALLDGWRAIERKVQSSETGPFSPSSVPFVCFSSLDVYGLSTAWLIIEDTLTAVAES